MVGNSSLPPQDNTTFHKHSLVLPHFNKLVVFIIIAFIGGILLGSWGILNNRSSQSQKEKQTATVIGTGTVKAPPDEATITFSVRTEASTKEEAQNSNKNQVTSLKNNLMAKGIPQDAMSDYMTTYPPVVSTRITPIPIPVPAKTQTEDSSSFSYDYDYNYDYYYSSNRNYYLVTTTITITLKEGLLERAEALAKEISDYSSIKLNPRLTYMLKNPTKYKDKAREEAIKDARNQIESIAKVNKMKVTKLISIKDLESLELAEQIKKYGNYYQKSQKKTFLLGEKTADVIVSYEVKYELEPSSFFF